MPKVFIGDSVYIENYAQLCDNLLEVLLILGSRPVASSMEIVIVTHHCVQNCV